VAEVEGGFPDTGAYRSFASFALISTASNRFKGLVHFSTLDMVWVEETSAQVTQQPC
jgi:hypothetical protein